MSPTTRDVARGDRQERRGDPAGRRELLLVILSVPLVLGSFRVLFPLAYNLGERTSFVTAGYLAVAVFLLPLLGPLLARLAGPRTALVGPALGLAAARVAVQLVHPVPLWLGVAVAGFGLLLLGVVMTGLRADGGRGGRRFLLGLVLGMALDAAIMGAFRTWEASWQAGMAPLALTLVLSALILTAAWVTGADRAPPSSSVWATAALGPFLMLDVLFLQNPAFVASATGFHLPAALALVLLGDGLAAGVLAWLWGRAPGPSIRVGLGVTMILLAAFLNEAGGVLAVVLFGAAQPVAASLLAVALGREGRPGYGRMATGLLVASLVFILLTLLFYLHYDVPLPFPNVVLAPAAGALLALAAIRGAPPAQAPAGPAWPAALPVALVLVPAALFLSMPVPDPGTPAGGAFRVVDYNVHTTVDVHGQVDPEAVASIIEAQGPDVVVLQEVSRGWAVAGSIDSAEWLSERLGMPYVYAPAADRGFGNAILSRFPIVGADHGFLPTGTGPMARSWVRVLLDMGGGRRVTVIGTHLHHRHEEPADDRTRLAQIGALLGVWGGASGTVVAGDMNATPDSRQFQRLEAAGLVAAGDLSVPTSPSTDPRNRIDYLFTTPDLTARDALVPGAIASDHLAVAATVGFGGRP